MKYRVILLAMALSFLFACGGDDIDCENIDAVNTMNTAAFQRINTAINAFNDSERGEAECEVLVEAYDEFIDVLEDVSTCGLDVTQQIADAQRDRGNLSCS